MNTDTDDSPEFAVCINHDVYHASLEVGTLYPVIPDEDAVAHGYYA